MAKIAFLILGVTVFGDGTEPVSVSVAFTATIVSSASIDYEIYQRGSRGMAVGKYNNTATMERYSFVVPLEAGMRVVLSPGVEPSEKDGVAYVSVEQYGVNEYVELSQ
jgi:hypothetical protein